MTLLPSSIIEHQYDGQVDIIAILQASQTLSRQIQLDELLQQLTQIILQNSGGDRCALILPNNAGELQVRAIATPNHTELCCKPLSDNIDLPLALIQYVRRTQEAVVIDDLKTELPVICEFLREQQTKSLLCLPILNQGQLLGILYLNNQLTSGTFTSDRVLVLNFLCTQAAISLENARLFQQTQAQEEYMRSLYDGVEHLIFVVDVLPNQQDVRWFGWNAATEAATGMNSADIAGKSPEEIFGEVEGKNVRQNMMNCLAAGTSISYEECITFNHQKTWWLTTLKPLRNLENQIHRIIGTTISVTDLKSVEAALRQNETELRQKANDLEQAMTCIQQAQLQMVQTEKMASLGNLVAGVAHEINNPIGFLNGSISNARDYASDLLRHLSLYQQHYPNPVASIQKHAEDIDLEFLTEDLGKLLESMKGATDRIKGISNSLRTFSRADTENQVKANLQDGLESTLLILKYRLQANEYRPAIEVSQNYGNIPEIMCFPGQLNQVFMNLLANAIDMFDEVAQTLSISELQANPQKIYIQTKLINNQVEISIRDNGKGMAEEIQAKIFDHLFTTKGVGKGTGLGLAIARQIIEEKQGGKLSVRSQVGQGSEFMITLPL
jgi:PAS domain S-box-containing protein